NAMGSAIDYDTRDDDMDMEEDDAVDEEESAVPRASEPVINFKLKGKKLKSKVKPQMGNSCPKG
ncbi:hypothetical protein BGZ65_009893, partial [Modicella reniformis]